MLRPLPWRWKLDGREEAFKNHHKSGWRFVIWVGLIHRSDRNSWSLWAISTAYYQGLAGIEPNVTGYFLKYLRLIMTSLTYHILKLRRMERSSCGLLFQTRYRSVVSSQLHTSTSIRLTSNNPQGQRIICWLDHCWSHGMDCSYRLECIEGS